MGRTEVGARSASVVFKAPGPEWTRFEDALEAKSVPLALHARASWVRSLGERVWLVGLLDAGGEPWFGFAVAATRSRALPGARILRVPRFGHGIPPGAVDTACAVLGDLARSARALRLHIELYVPEDPLRAVLAEAFGRGGFVKSAQPRLYQRTVLIDLHSTEDEILASFHRKCRKNIRALNEQPLLECGAITDPSLAGRMTALLDETMARTGGQRVVENWPAWIAFVAERPDLAHLVGVFSKATTGPDALVGYVLGIRHGDTAEYSVAASTRLAGSRTPLLYAPAWQLMQWAKRVGATTFDFGGITAGTAHSADPVGGISDFKGSFSRNVVEVGGEFVLEPSRWLSAVASTVSAAATAVRRLSTRSERPQAHAAPAESQGPQTEE